VDIKWDISAENYFLALDGVSPAEFARDFSSVEIVGVDIEDLHVNLMPISQRLKDPLTKHYKLKTAGLVAHLESGGIVTPAFVRHVEGGLCFAGGNHRFGWARYRQQGRVPILVVSDEIVAIRANLVTFSSWP
jgi:hypothetical protein